MPHFIIETTKEVYTKTNPDTLLKALHNCAVQSNLFNEKDIKVRIRNYELYSVSGSKEDFIHVFGYIMEGRSTSQKANLSKSFVETLTTMFPHVQIISMNMKEFEKATYCNRYLLT